MRQKKKQITKSKKRSILLVSAITMHNIPEGLAIGVQNDYYIFIDNVIWSPKVSHLIFKFFHHSKYF